MSTRYSNSAQKTSSRYSNSERAEDVLAVLEQRAEDVLPVLKQRSLVDHLPEQKYLSIPMCCASVVPAEHGRNRGLCCGWWRERELRLQAGSSRVDKESFRGKVKKLGLTWSQLTARSIWSRANRSTDDAQTGQRLTGSQQTRVLSACGC